MSAIAALDQLPVEIFDRIVHYFTPYDLENVARVSRHFRYLLESRLAKHEWLTKLYRRSECGIKKGKKTHESLVSDILREPLVADYVEELVTDGLERRHFTSEGDYIPPGNDASMADVRNIWLPKRHFGHECSSLSHFDQECYASVLFRKLPALKRLKIDDRMKRRRNHLQLHFSFSADPLVDPVAIKRGQQPLLDELESLEIITIPRPTASNVFFSILFFAQLASMTSLHVWGLYPGAIGGGDGEQLYTVSTTITSLSLQCCRVSTRKLSRMLSAFPLLRSLHWDNRWPHKFGRVMASPPMERLSSVLKELCDEKNLRSLESLTLRSKISDTTSIGNNICGLNTLRYLKIDAKNLINRDEEAASLPGSIKELHIHYTHCDPQELEFFKDSIVQYLSLSKLTLLQITATLSGNKATKMKNIGSYADLARRCADVGVRFKMSMECRGCVMDEVDFVQYFESMESDWAESFGDFGLALIC